jgi:chromosome segregation ATPase
MLIRISLILALLTALAVGVVNVVVVKDKINTLVTDRNTQRDGKTRAEGERNKANKDLAKAKDDLTLSQQELAAAKTEREKAVAVAAAQSKRAEELADKLTRTAQDLDTTQTKLAAYVATGKTADQVGQLARSLKDMTEALEVANEEKIVLMHTVTRLTNELAKYTGAGEYIVKLRADLRGKIVTVDPKWDFVVLNIGESQGVIEDGELLVSRDGKLVAKVVVRSVERNRCIANVIPGWKLGEVIEGDEVTPAHPAS